MEGLSDRSLDVGNDAGDSYGRAPPPLAGEGIGKVLIARGRIPGHLTNVIVEQVGVRSSTRHRAVGLEGLAVQIARVSGVARGELATKGTDCATSTRASAGTGTVAASSLPVAVHTAPQAAHTPHAVNRIVIAAVMRPPARRRRRQQGLTTLTESAGIARPSQAGRGGYSHIGIVPEKSPGVLDRA